MPLAFGKAFGPTILLCVYDGRPVGVGRVVTDSSFHHYLDLNLIGDPCGSTVDRTQGFGQAYTTPESGGVLADLAAFYVNTVVWLARPESVPISPVLKAHEVDVAWIVALFLGIHGGDPNPSERQVSEAARQIIDGLMGYLVGAEFSVTPSPEFLRRMEVAGLQVMEEHVQEDAALTSGRKNQLTPIRVKTSLGTFDIPRFERPRVNDE